MAAEAEVAAMRRAIALSAAVVQPTSPNPVVGCVVLDAVGSVAGEGVSEPRGGAHAEVVALRAAGARAGGGTAVVTLEPCNSVGRSGACSKALLDAGVRRLVYAVTDPMPPFSDGAHTLSAAGVDVEGGVLADEAAVPLDTWLRAARAQRPYVTWKFAASLDGRTAAADGTSRWITGPDARAEVHAMRARHDAVLVGVGTVLADDPALTVRDAPGPQPLRVVLDSHGRTPPQARVRDGSAETLVLTRDDVPAGEGGLHPGGALEVLYDRGVRSVLVEGGASVAGSFLRAGLVDRVVAYVAPALLGDGTGVLSGAGIGTIAAAVRLDLLDVGRVGGDVRIVATPGRTGS